MFLFKPLTASLIIRLIPKKDLHSPAVVCQEIEGQECIYTNVEAVNCLLNFNATDKVIEIVVSEIESLKSFPLRSTEQFAKALRDKALQCYDPFLKQQTKEMFAKELPLNVLNSVCRD